MVTITLRLAFIVILELGNNLCKINIIPVIPPLTAISRNQAGVHRPTVLNMYKNHNACNAMHTDHKEFVLSNISVL